MIGRVLAWLWSVQPPCRQATVDLHAAAADFRADAQRAQRAAWDDISRSFQAMDARQYPRGQINRAIEDVVDRYREAHRHDR